MMAHAKALVARGVKVTVATPDFVFPGEGPCEPPQLAAIPGVEPACIITDWRELSITTERATLP